MTNIFSLDFFIFAFIDIKIIPELKLKHIFNHFKWTISH